MPSKDLLRVLGLYTALAGTCWAFWPGLTGPFLFDDFPNLSQLGTLGGVTDFNSALRFILGGDAGPLGRPLSLASFLINDVGWPSDPYGFKYTNLMLHLLTGVSLFGFLHELERSQAPARQTNGHVPLLVTALWLMHPMQSAPIFLVVQRMTILSALFTFMGLSVWLRGRNRLASGRKGGYWRMTVGISGFGLLAVLCKENGALLPFLAFVCELTLAPLPSSRGSRLWKALFFATPAALLAGYFAISWHNFIRGYEVRDFNMKERLMTEWLVLFDYLRTILIPDMRTTIFRDDFPIIKTFNATAATALACWTALVASSLYLKRQFPLLAFAVLFFLVGHSLEAGPIPLELYFVHRNYVPMVGVLYALFAAVAQLLKSRPRIAYVLGVCSIALTAVVTHAESTYWGNEALFVNAWANERPGSPRAAAMAANFWGTHGQYKKAIQIVERTLAITPDSLTLQVGDYYEHCLAGTEDSKLWVRISSNLPYAPRDTAVLDALDILARNIRDHTCKDVSIQDIVSAIDLLKQNPAFGAAQQQARIDYALAMYFLELGQTGSAVGALEQAVTAAPTVYEYELLGDLYREGGMPAKAVEMYEKGLAIPLFRGWRARILKDKPQFPVLEKKLHDTRADLNGPVNATPP